MSASIKGSKLWWDVVQSMPVVEAKQQLEMYKATLLEEVGDKKVNGTATYALNRVNSELKQLNLRIDNSLYYKACHDVLPPDLFDAVLARKRVLENEGYTT